MKKLSQASQKQLSSLSAEEPSEEESTLHFQARVWLFLISQLMAMFFAVCALLHMSFIGWTQETQNVFNWMCWFTVGGKAMRKILRK